MSKGYDVQAGELDGHARHLDGIVDELHRALDAARQVSLPTNAYGIICAFFPPLLYPVHRVGLDAIKESVAAMTDNAAGIRSNADGYRAADQRGAGSFTRRPR